MLSPSIPQKRWICFLKSCRRIRLSFSARKDLESIAAYTAKEWGTVQRKKYMLLIKNGFLMLQENPLLGRMRDDIDTDLFSYPVEKHIIFYRSSAESLLVVRILDGRMDIPAILSQDG